MKLLGVYKDTNGEIKNNIYYNFDIWFRDTFSPATEVLTCFMLKVVGETYEQKKEDLKQKAIEFQNTWQVVSWSYSEITEISDFFYKNGKRYGLLREFRENGII